MVNFKHDPKYKINKLVKVTQAFKSSYFGKIYFKLGGNINCNIILGCLVCFEPN